MKGNHETRIVFTFIVKISNDEKKMERDRIPISITAAVLLLLRFFRRLRGEKRRTTNAKKKKNHQTREKFENIYLYIYIYIFI